MAFYPRKKSTFFNGGQGVKELQPCTSNNFDRANGSQDYNLDNSDEEATNLHEEANETTEENAVSGSAQPTPTATVEIIDVQSDEDDSDDVFDIDNFDSVCDSDSAKKISPLLVNKFVCDNGRINYHKNCRSNSKYFVHFEESNASGSSQTFSSGGKVYAEMTVVPNRRVLQFNNGASNNYYGITSSIQPYVNSNSDIQSYNGIYTSTTVEEGQQNAPRSGSPSNYLNGNSKSLHTHSNLSADHLKHLSKSFNNIHGSHNNIKASNLYDNQVSLSISDMPPLSSPNALCMNGTEENRLYNTGNSNSVTGANVRQGFNCGWNVAQPSYINSNNVPSYTNPIAGMMRVNSTYSYPEYISQSNHLLEPITNSINNNIPMYQSFPESGARNKLEEHNPLDSDLNGVRSDPFSFNLTTSQVVAKPSTNSVARNNSPSTVSFQPSPVGLRYNHTTKSAFVQVVPQRNSQQQQLHPHYHSEQQQQKYYGSDVFPVSSSPPVVDHLANGNNSSCSDDSNSAFSNSSDKKRVQTCRLCHNHGKETPIKGHKYFCPHQKCKCENCKITLTRRHFVKEQLKITRRQGMSSSNQQHSTPNGHSIQQKVASKEMQPYPKKDEMIRDLAKLENCDLFEKIANICRPQVETKES